ncbi:MAG TPA: adenylate/guanylate cyclase domain-containing protein [Gaiellales bacterium]|nr:adenylate/guanylate cyclase domain-containing protein [Gaiellales bacterium]
MSAGDGTLEQIAEIRRRVRRASGIANSAGALVTFAAAGNVIPVFYSSSLSNRTGVINGPLVFAVVATGIYLGFRLGDRAFEPIRSWLLAGCPPESEAASRALLIPLRNAQVTATLWLAGAALFAVFNALLVSLAFGALIAVTVVLGGLTTSALVYLLTERIDRPITARALAAMPEPDRKGPGIRTRLIAAWSLGTGVPLLGALAIGVVGIAKPDVNPGYIGGATVFLAAVALGAGLVALLFAAGSIADPVASVRGGVERVEAGDFQARVEVDDASEVGLLQAGFNRMAEGLGERELLRDLFGRHVGRDVARAALDGGVALGGEEREIAALFVDVAGSTRLASELPPSEVVALLNRFFAVAVEIVEAAGGLVNKFEGDAALAVFGAPVARSTAATDALSAARRLAERLRAEVGELDFGIGVSAGVAVAGNVGAEERFEYTVIGDPVNEAARVCELAKARPGRVIASAATLEAAAPEEVASWRLGEQVALRGRAAQTTLALPADEAPAET